jgi:hypothetical protein
MTMLATTKERTMGTQDKAAPHAFHSDFDPETSYECFGFDEPWNGWVTPIVDWQTVFDVLQDAEWLVRTEGAVILAARDAGVPEDEIVVLEPDNDGRYHLRDLGWTLSRTETSDAQILPFAPPKGG